MFSFDPTTYGNEVAELLPGDRLGALGPGQPNFNMRDQLRGLSVEALFPSVGDAEMARCCLSGLWLWHDYLDESHQISQEIGSSSGSLWHGIMHRREPDYSNAKYWYRRVGDHAIFSALRATASELAESHGTTGEATYLTSQSAWDPFAFVDLCSSVARGNADCELLCREIARVEWQLLFDDCYQRAT
jgi:hypothetical protein